MYGLMLRMAIFMATSVAFLAWRDGRGWEKAAARHRHLWRIQPSLVGARLWDVFFFDWGYYSDHLLEIPFVWAGRYGHPGGILGGVAAVSAFYCWRHKVNWIEMLDVICPALSSARASAAWPTC